MRAYGPLFRHLYGVTEDEVWDWPLERWNDYREFADAWMDHNGYGTRS